MPYVKINTILKQDLAPNGKLEVAYPEGVNEGSFFGAIDHTLGIETRFFRSPKDFIVIPTPDNLVIHWTANLNIPAGALLYFQLQEQGGDYYTDNRTGVTVRGMVEARTFLINLGSVRDKDPIYYVHPTQVSSGGRLLLANNKPDVSRNVIVYSDSDESNRTFIIHGEDIYLRPMVEYLRGPTAGKTNGKKAFAKINKISVDGPCNGAINIGTGNRIGLPSFVPGPGYVLSEMVNGTPVSGGMIVPGELNLAGPTTGDRRGTYTPPPSVNLNGRDTIQLFLILPNPGNIGTTDYSGDPT
jgi:hypothetical protein